jgi:hypothetical protein
MNRQTYEQLLAHANAHKGRKRGIKLNKTYWLRRHPDDETKVQIGFYYHLLYKNDEMRHAECVAPIHRPFVAMMTLSNDGAEFHLPNVFKQLKIDIPEEVVAEYKDIYPICKPCRVADITFNNFLFWMGTTFTKPSTSWIRYQGCGDPGFGGFFWMKCSSGRYRSETAKTKLAGPVFYEWDTGSFIALEPQPTRVVSPLQSRVSKALRSAFTKLRALGRMGVTVNAPEIDAVMAAIPVDDLRNPHMLLDMLETFKPTDRKQVVELAARLAVPFIPPYYFEARRATHPAGFNLARVALGRIDMYDSGFIPVTETHLNALRRALHKALDVVQYQPASREQEPQP